MESDSDPTTIKLLINDYVNQNKLIDDIQSQININNDMNSNDSNDHILIRYVHQIDVNQLNLNLVQHLVQNMDEFIRFMREDIVHKLTQIRQNKITVLLSIKPTHLSNKVSTKRNAECSMRALIDATIVSLSVEHRSIIASKYVCKKCINQSYDEWLIRELNQTRAQFRESNPKCYNCAELLVESKHKRVYASKRFALIRSGNDKRGQMVNISCDLFENDNCVYIGAHFNCVVINENHELISFEKTQPTIETLFSQIVTRLPNRIRDLYNDRMASPYSFGMSLAYIFGETVSAGGTYFRLKLGIILSLLSCYDLQKIYSSILAVSSDTTMVRKIMEFASGFVKQFVNKSPSYPITGSSYIEHRSKGSDITWIDGRSLLLASDGVCVFYDIMSFSEKEKIYLRQAMENNEVVVALPPPNIKPFQCELRASIWAVIEDRALTGNQIGLSAKMKHKSMSWVNTFPMVYVIDDEPFLEPNPDQTLTNEEWIEFFDLLKRLPTPEITIDAQYLINAYFIGIRKCRGFNCKPNAISTLISLAKSFAKFNLRSNVTKYDALIAILLYEESLTYQFGYSPLKVKPVSHITDHSLMCAAIGPNFDINMEEFESKLNKFINDNTKPNDRMLSQLISQREE